MNKILSERGKKVCHFRLKQNNSLQIQQNRTMFKTSLSGIFFFAPAFFFVQISLTLFKLCVDAVRRFENVEGEDNLQSWRNVFCWLCHITITIIVAEFYYIITASFY